MAVTSNSRHRSTKLHCLLCGMLYLIVIVCATTPSVSQLIIVRSVKPLAYPLMQATVYAFDSVLRPTKFSQNDRTITENGSRQVLASIGIPPSDTQKPACILLALDCHTPQLHSSYVSMITGLYRAKHPDTRIGLLCYSRRAVILHDFTSDTNRLANVLSRLPDLGGATDFTTAFMDEYTGIISMLRRLQERCDVVVLHQGKADCTTSIILASLSSLTIPPTLHTISLDNNTSQQLTFLSTTTNGISTSALSSRSLQQACIGILRIAEGTQPSTFIWSTDRNWCFRERNVRFMLQELQVSNTYTYKLPDSTERFLEVSRTYIDFNVVPRGKTATEQITLTARGDDIVVTGINSSSPLYSITGLPAVFTIPKNQSRIITISFTPSDTLRRISEFTIASTSCRNHAFYTEANSGYNPALIPELTTFTGGASLLAGTDTTLRWRGVTPLDTVVIEYSPDAGVQWIMITDTGRGMEQKWRIPYESTKSLLFRIKQRSSPANPRLSDSLNSIVVPDIKAVPLDFGDVQEGTSFIKRFNNAVCNPLPTLVRVDSVSIPESSRFIYASGLPRTLINGSCADVDITYTPEYKTGVSDSVVIRYHTPSGIVPALLRGNALPRKLLTPKYVYFGVLSLGETRDTIMNIACLTNTNNATITSAQIDYGNVPQFSRSEAAFPLTLNQDERCWSSTLRFIAGTVGRSSARLIITTSNNEVYEFILVADVVCGLPYPSMRISIPDTLTADIGTQLVSSVRLSNSPQSFMRMNRPFRAVIAFNKTMLSPRAEDPQGIIVGNERFITIQGRGFAKGDTLFTMTLNTALGNDDRTPIRIIEFRWLDECSELVEGESSLFLVGNICRAGGRRLYIDNEGLVFRQVVPNPTTDLTIVEFSLRENGSTTLELIDMLGNHVKSIFTQDLPAGVYQYPLDVSQIVAGHYIAVLTTPTKRITTAIGVVR